MLRSHWRYCVLALLKARRLEGLMPEKTASSRMVPAASRAAMVTWKAPIWRYSLLMSGAAVKALIFMVLPGRRDALDAPGLGSLTLRAGDLCGMAARDREAAGLVALCVCAGSNVCALADGGVEVPQVGGRGVHIQTIALTLG
jgi:hypothetical protein